MGHRGRHRVPFGARVGSQPGCVAGARRICTSTSSRLLPRWPVSLVAGQPQSGFRNKTYVFL
eukprot:3360296-Lingulodinium_polyedra.AAC.1